MHTTRDTPTSRLPRQRADGEKGHCNYNHTRAEGDTATTSIRIATMLLVEHHNSLIENLLKERVLG